LPAYLDELAGRAERMKKDGTAFGLPQLDATLGFHQPGDLLVIGSNSGKGKSLISLQGAIYNAKGRGIATGIISLEMEENQTYDRVFSHIGKISMNGFKTGEFTSEGLERIHQVHESLSTTPLWFYREKTDLESVKSRARRLCAIEGIKLLVIDYMQLIRLKHTRLSRQEQLEFIANDLKQFAHELGVVIWCPVQLNKDGDPRGAMDILQASDILFRLVMNKNSEVDGKMEIDKSRQGESSTIIPVSRKGWYMTIEENEE
jgi:replicative DNA helicase